LGGYVNDVRYLVLSIPARHMGWKTALAQHKYRRARGTLESGEQEDPKESEEDE